MKRVLIPLILLLAGFNHDALGQCSATASFGFLTSAQTVCGNDVFSRRIYIEEDGSGTWTGATSIQVEVDWGDGSAPQLYNIPFNVGFGAWTDLVSHTAPDGVAHTNCTYQATAVLYVDGVDCSAIAQLGNGGIQTLNVVIWDEIDNPNLGTHDTELSPNTATGGMNGNIIEVCEGDTQDVVVMDNSDFNCSNAEPILANRNDQRRWIQFVYGTGATNITGVVDVGGVPQPTLPYYGDVQLVPFGAPVATNEDALAINFPATAVAGEIFEVTLRSWNVCNPYDDNLGDGELNPVGGVFDVDNPSFPNAIEAPIEITQIIEIIDKPNSPTPNPEIICLNDAVPNVTVTPAAGATSIIWYDADPTLGVANVLQNSAATFYVTGVSSAVANEYSYWVTQINAGDNNCESDPVEVTLTIKEELSIDPIDFDTYPGETEVCTGMTGLIFSVPNPAAAETFGGATVYDWNVIGAGISIVGPTNGQSITVDITNGTTGTRTIELTRQYTAAPTCPEVVTYDIDIFPLTVPGTLSGGTDICEGESTPTLTLSGYTGSILRWERSYNAGAFVDIGNAGNDTFDEVLGTDGSYEYRVVVQSGNQCNVENSTSTTVNVFDVPGIPTAGSDADLCGVLTYALAGSSAAPYTGQWSVITNPSGTSPVFSDATSPTSDVTILAGDEGTYEFQWTVTNGPCDASDDVQVIFREAPTTANAGGDDTACGTSYTMGANTITVGAGTWSVIAAPGGLTVDDVNDPATDISLDLPRVYGVYTLQWESVNGVPTCNSVSTVDITFVQGGESYADADQELCMDATAISGIAISGTIDGLSTSGNWEVVTGNGVIQSSGGAVGNTVAGAAPFTINDVYVPDATDVGTIVEVRLKADSPNASCPDEYSSMQISINEMIVVDATTNGTNITPTEICQSSSSLSAFAVYGSLSGGTLASTGIATLSGHWEIVSGAGTLVNGASISGSVINDGYTPAVADLGTTVTLQLVGEDTDGAGPCNIVVDQIDIYINEAITADATTNGADVTPLAACVDATLQPFDVYGQLTGGVLGATSTAVHSGHWEVISGNGTMVSSGVATGSTITASAIDDQYQPTATDLGTTITLRLVADDPDGAAPCSGDFDDIMIEINEALIADASTNGTNTSPTEVCVNPTVLASFNVYGSISGGRLGTTGVPVRAGHWEVASGTGTMTSTNNIVGSSITGSVINDSYKPATGDLGTTVELHLVAEDNDAVVGPCGDVIDVLMIEINELLVADATGDGTNSTPTAVCIDAANIAAFDIYGGISGGKLGSSGVASLNGHWEVVTGNGTFTSSGTNTGTTITGSASIQDAYLPDASDIGSTVRLRLVAEDPDAAGPCSDDTDEINIQINEEGFVTANQSVIAIAAGSIVVGGLGVDELGVVLSGSGSSGQWSVVSLPNEGTFSNINSLTPTFTPSATQELVGSVTLQFDMDDTDGMGPCTSKFVQVQINIAQNPSADAGTLSDICEDEIVNLSGTIGGSATTGTWTVTGGVGVLSISSVTGNTVTATYTPDAADAGNSLTFTLTTDDPDGAGPVLEASDDVSLTINPLPVIAGINGDVELCAGDIESYFVQGGNASTSSYTWDLSSLGTAGVHYEIQAGDFPLHFISIEYLLPITNGTITVTENINATGCESSFDLTGINVYATPDVDLVSSDADMQICEGEEVTFTAEAVSGIMDGVTTYEFIGNGVTLQTGTSNTFTTTSLQNGTPMLVKVSNGAGLCWEQEGPIVHIVENPPNAKDQSIDICSDIAGVGQVTYDLTSLDNKVKTGNNTVVWYSEASLTDLITNPVSYIVNDGDILYAQINPGGCYSVAEVDFTINPSPEISLAVTSDYEGFGVSCFGANDGQVTAALTANGTSPYQYSINGGTTFQASPIFDNLEAGIYEVLIQDASGCDFTSPAVLVADPLPLSPGLVTGGAVICGGDDVPELTELSPAFGGVGNYTYQWQYSTDQVSWTDVPGGTSNELLPDAALIVGVTYFRRLVFSGSCNGQASNMTEISINALPTGTFDFLSIDGTQVITEVCENTPFMIQFQFTGSEPFYFDYSDGTNTFENQFGAATMLVPVTQGITEDLTIDLTKVKDLKGCESVLSATKTLSVININTEFTLDPSVSCSGAEIEFTFTVDPDIEYTWNFGDGQSEVIPANTLPVGTNSITHQYNNGSPSTTFNFVPFLIAEKVNGTHCGPVQHFETVTIYPSVLPNVYTPTDEICSGELISFDNQTLGAANHEWFYRRQGVDEQVDFQTTKQADFTIYNTGENNPQVYEIVYRGFTDNSGDICETTQVILVNVYKYAEPDFSFSPENPVIQNGATSIAITNMTDPIDNTNFQYNWEFGDGLVAVDEVDPANVSYTQAGDKEVKLTVVNRMNESCTNTIYKIIPIEDIPINADFVIEPGSGCTPVEIQVSNNTFGSADKFTWTIYKQNSEVVYEAIQLAEPGEPAPVSFSRTLYEAGLYSVQLVAENSYTGQKDVVYKENAVEVYPIPTAAFEVRPYTVYLPDQILQTFNYTDINDANVWFWDFGDGIGTSNDFEPDYQYTEEGEYVVQLVAGFEHEGGILCADTLGIQISVEKGGITRVPNAFTPSQHGPSSDGRIQNEVDNDIFLPITEGVLDEGYRMMVFDRWGNLLFESHDKEVGWDGYTHEGKPLPAGVYVYKLSLTLETGEREEMIGDINLIR